MGNYILCRFLVIIPLLIVISVISFIVVQLPPGSYVETYIQNLKNQGYQPDENEIERLESRYGLNQPAYIQYFTWMKNIIFKGDMGRSFVYKQPVTEIIAERAPMTIMISMMAMLLQWIVAVPIDWNIFSSLSVFNF